jgi:hypothetical protein
MKEPGFKRDLRGFCPVQISKFLCGKQGAEDLDPVQFIFPPLLVGLSGSLHQTSTIERAGL